eukprot:30802-Pelagococcus_subviridis.AAC.31
MHAAVHAGGEVVHPRALLGRARERLWRERFQLFERLEQRPVGDGPVPRRRRQRVREHEPVAVGLRLRGTLDQGDIPSRVPRHRPRERRLDERIVPGGGGVLRQLRRASRRLVHDFRFDRRANRARDRVEDARGVRRHRRVRLRVRAVPFAAVRGDAAVHRRARGRLVLADVRLEPGAVAAHVQERVARRQRDLRVQRDVFRSLLRVRVGHDRARDRGVVPCVTADVVARQRGERREIVRERRGPGGAERVRAHVENFEPLRAAEAGEAIPRREVVVVHDQLPQTVLDRLAKHVPGVAAEFVEPGVDGVDAVSREHHGAARLRGFPRARRRLPLKIVPARVQLEPVVVTQLFGDRTPHVLIRPVEFIVRRRQVFVFDVEDAETRLAVLVRARISRPSRGKVHGINQRHSLDDGSASAVRLARIVRRGHRNRALRRVRFGRVVAPPSRARNDPAARGRHVEKRVAASLWARHRALHDRLDARARVDAVVRATVRVVRSGTWEVISRVRVVDAGGALRRRENVERVRAPGHRLAPTRDPRLERAAVQRRDRARDRARVSRRAERGVDGRSSRLRFFRVERLEASARRAEARGDRVRGVDVTRRHRERFLALRAERRRRRAQRRVRRRHARREYVRRRASRLVDALCKVRHQTRKRRVKRAFALVPARAPSSLAARCSNARTSSLAGSAEVRRRSFASTPSIARNRALVVVPASDSKLDFASSRCARAAACAGHAVAIKAPRCAARLA